MAYNFDSGFYHQQITKFVREVLDSPSCWKYCMQFNSRSSVSDVCRPYSCKELREFCLSYSRLGEGSIDDRLTGQLFDEFCKAFHSVEEEMDSYTYEWFCYVVNATSLPEHSNAKQEFMRLMSAFETNKNAMNKIHELTAHQRNKVHLALSLPQKQKPKSQKDDELEKDLMCLDAIAKDLVAEWNNKWQNIILNMPQDVQSASAQKYFRFNIRCRLINYARENFPRLDSRTRNLILTFFQNRSTIFHMLPAVGCDVLTFPDYPSDRCIFKGVNSCCMLKSNAEPKLCLTSDETKRRLAQEFALSDLPVMTYNACLLHNDVVVKKSRMAYARNFV